MTRTTDILLTSVAPAVWGSTYLVTTETLPTGYPLTLAVLRALPAGLLLLLIVRQLPQGIWWAKVAILGALNFSVFWWLLFEAAYRLPGGVAATAGAIQPLLVLMLARGFLGTPLKLVAVLAAFAGLGGVAILVLTPGAALNPLGIAASLVGAVPAQRLESLVRRKNGHSQNLSEGTLIISFKIDPRAVVSDCCCCCAVVHEQPRRQELRVGGQVR